MRSDVGSTSKSVVIHFSLTPRVSGGSTPSQARRGSGAEVRDLGEGGAGTRPPGARGCQSRPPWAGRGGASACAWPRRAARRHPGQLGAAPAAAGRAAGRGAMELEPELLLQEARENVEAAQSYRRELGQRLQGLREARRQVGGPRPERRCGPRGGRGVPGGGRGKEGSAGWDVRKLQTEKGRGADVLGHPAGSGERGGGCWGRV